MRPHIQPGSEDHCLRAAGLGCVYEEFVEKPATKTDLAKCGRRVQRLGIGIVQQPNQMRLTGGPHEMLRVLVAHQGIRLRVLDRASRRDAQGGEPDARHNVPGIALAARPVLVLDIGHNVPFKQAVCRSGNASNRRAPGCPRGLPDTARHSVLPDQTCPPPACSILVWRTTRRAVSSPRRRTAR